MRRIQNEGSPKTMPRRGERGTALMEFALVLPFLLVLTLTVVDLSRAFWVKNMLYQGAREGARTLVVRPLADTSYVRARVNKVVGAAKVPVLSLIYLGPSDRQQGVRIQTQFRWLFPGLLRWLGASFTNPMTLTAEAWMRQETP